MSKSIAGVNLIDQIIRSSTSAALNYGEAVSAESKKDFTRKIKIILKELRETSIALEIIQQTKLSEAVADVEKAKKENNELISIFVKTLQTAQKNLQIK